MKSKQNLNQMLNGKGCSSRLRHIKFYVFSSVSPILSSLFIFSFAFSLDFQFQFQSICSHWVSSCMYLCAAHYHLMDPHYNRYVIGCCLGVFAYRFSCLQVSCHFSFYWCVFFSIFHLLEGAPRATYCGILQWNDAASYIDYAVYHTVCSTFLLAYFNGGAKTRKEEKNENDKYEKQNLSKWSFFVPI